MIPKLDFGMTCGVGIGPLRYYVLCVFHYCSL